MQISLPPTSFSQLVVIYPQWYICYCAFFFFWESSGLILFHFILFHFFGRACGILVPWPGIEPASPALEAWSLNHWTAREVPVLSCKEKNFTLFFIPSRFYLHFVVSFAFSYKNYLKYSKSKKSSKTNSYIPIIQLKK